MNEFSQESVRNSKFRVALRLVFDLQASGAAIHSRMRKRCPDDFRNSLQRPYQARLPRNPLVQLLAYGQSVWLDYIRRDLFTTGELARLIREDGLRGMTSNPTIFEKAIAGSDLYADQLKRIAGRTQYGTGYVLEQRSEHPERRPIVRDVEFTRRRRRTTVT